jgi:hypothetical protein
MKRFCSNTKFTRQNCVEIRSRAYRILPNCGGNASAIRSGAGAPLAIHHRIVIAGLARVASLLFLITLVTSAPIRADPVPRQPRLRLTDPRLEHVVGHGRRQSPSFQALLDQLEATDVVVYVQCARLRTGVDGQLTFVTAAAGTRYVLVQIAWDLPFARKIAILGHELQHALEVARNPDVVSAETMAAAYRRFGFTRNRAGKRVDFDSAAAIGAGMTIWRELAERDYGE